MEPKRVLQVLGSMQRAGAETMVMNLYRNIDRNIVQFDFLVKEPVENGFEEEIRSLGGNIFYLSSAKKLGILRYILTQTKIMRQNGPYVAIHSHMNMFSGVVMLSAFLAGIRIRIAHSHSTNFLYRKSAQTVFRCLICIFSTNRLACGIEAGRALFGKKGFTVLPNGIDIDQYLPAGSIKKSELREKLSMDSDTIQICHIGRFEKVKNHKFILDLAQKLRNEEMQFKIHLLGDGPLFEEISLAVRNTGLSEVVLHGNVDNVNEYLNVADFLVLPSYYEGLPMTLVEGQCAGVHCLVSDKVTQEVDIGVGLMDFLPLDVNEWVNKIKKYECNCTFVSNEEIKKKASVKGYSVKGNVARLMEFYSV